MTVGPGTAFIGIDPGGRQVGLVVRVGSECQAAEVLDLPGGIPSALEVAAVLHAVDTLIWSTDAHRLTVVVAVEGVQAPGGFAGGRKAEQALEAARAPVH